MDRVKTSILRGRMSCREKFLCFYFSHLIIKHKVASLVLKKMGSPDEHTKWVEKSHGDFEVVLNIGREEISFKCGCGVRQGDNLATTLFIIVMQLVAKDMVDELKKKV